jgi:hypothetical protein
MVGISAIKQVYQVPLTARVVVDVGGSRGQWINMILDQLHPEAVGIVFDLPHVASETDRHYKERGIDRISGVGGDFFDPDTIPKGALTLILT